MKKIYSPVFAGSGVVVLHKTLSRNIDNYFLEAFSPKWQYAPYLLTFTGIAGKYNVVHTSPDYARYFYKSGSRLVVTFHNYVLDKEMHSYSSVLQRLHYSTDLRWNIQKALSIADVVTSVSQATADLVRDDLGFTGEIRIIKNGVDTDKYFPGESDNKRDQIKVLFSGNLNRRKGAHLLFSIAEKLKKNITIYYTSGLNTNSRLPDHPQLQRLGSINPDEMNAIYQEMDLLLLPSIREGMNLSILEAMACGIPVVTSNCSSMPEQIIDGEGGFLCEPGDVDEFSKKINYLASTPGLIVDMGKFNRSRVETLFSLEQMVEKYTAVLTENI